MTSKTSCKKCRHELSEESLCPACGGVKQPATATGGDLGVKVGETVPLQEKYDTLARRAKAQVATSRWADTGKSQSKASDQFLTGLIIFCVFFIIIYEIYFLMSGN